MKKHEKNMKKHKKHEKNMKKNMKKHEKNILKQINLYYYYIYGVV
jgi:hypothetical protein